MKRMKFLVLILTLASGIATQAQDVKQWSLEECIDYAHDNNLNVQRSELAVKGNEVNLKQDQLSRIPSLNSNLYNSWRWGRSIDPTTNVFTTNRINSNGFNVNTNMTVYNGNRQVNAIRQSKKNIEASYFDLQKTKNDVVLDVVGAYLNVIFARELLENAKTQLGTTTTQLNQTKKLVDAGSLPITNLLDLQAEEASNDVNVINAENDVELTLLRLKQILLIPGSEPFDIITPDFQEDNYQMIAFPVDEVYNQAEAIQPEVKSADLYIESAEYGVKLAKGAKIPSIGISGQFFTNYSDQNREFVDRVLDPDADPFPIGFLESDPSQIVVQPVTNSIFEDINIPTQWTDNRSWSVGFNIFIPIFQGYQLKSNVQRAKIEIDRANIAAQETRQGLRIVIETAYNDAQAASKVFDAARKQVEALEESFRATEKSYNLGAVNFVDYQVVSNTLFGARSDLVRAKFDYIFKLKILDFYLGNPLTL
jgi:outer membrane protein